MHSCATPSGPEPSCYCTCTISRSSLFHPVHVSISPCAYAIVLSASAPSRFTLPTVAVTPSHAVMRLCWRCLAVHLRTLSRSSAAQTLSCRAPVQSRPSHRLSRQPSCAVVPSFSHHRALLLLVAPSCSVPAPASPLICNAGALCISCMPIGATVPWSLHLGPSISLFYEVHVDF
ncbi:hypothetical protein DENSPDRAFT_128371 [Dentipellis sp. KUC8613]|nr:hypothetical protein DENSPDRAFT_128371 [Dentipellis sp. KUC8613]